jgi:hypothetical protein
MKKYRGVTIRRLSTGWYYAEIGQGVARKSLASLKRDIDRRLDSRRPRRARRNPGSSTVVWVLLGAAAVGGVIYFATKKPAPALPA